MPLLKAVCEVKEQIATCCDLTRFNGIRKDLKDLQKQCQGFANKLDDKPRESMDSVSLKAMNAKLDECLKYKEVLANIQTDSNNTSVKIEDMNKSLLTQVQQVNSKCEKVENLSAQNKLALLKLQTQMQNLDVNYKDLQKTVLAQIESVSEKCDNYGKELDMGR